LLTLPGEDRSPPGKRPRNSYMTNLDGLCQGGAEGENIQKLPGLVKRPKKKQKGSLEESCENLIIGTADGREERRIRCMYSYMYLCVYKYVYVCMYLCVCACMCVCNYVCMF